MDRDALGKTGVPMRMRVEHGKIREFAHAIKDDNPMYFDEEYARAEAGGILAPPTFTVALAFWDDGGGRRPIDVDLRRLLHGGQEFEFVRPIRAGDVLTAQARVADVYTKPGKRGGEMTFAVIETEFKNQDGDVVLYSRSTLIETSKPVEKKG